MADPAVGVAGCSGDGPAICSSSEQYRLMIEAAQWDEVKLPTLRMDRLLRKDMVLFALGGLSLVPNDNRRASETVLPLGRTRWRVDCEVARRDAERRLFSSCWHSAWTPASSFGTSAISAVISSVAMPLLVLSALVHDRISDRICRVPSMRLLPLRKSQRQHQRGLVSFDTAPEIRDLRLAEDQAHLLPALLQQAVFGRERVVVEDFLQVLEAALHAVQDLD